jgi:hypothetical protein
VSIHDLEQQLATRKQRLSRIQKLLSQGRDRYVIAGRDRSRRV